MTLICTSVPARRSDGVLPFEEHRAREPAVEQRHRVGERRALNAGDRRHAFEQALLELPAALLRVPLRAQIERHRRQMFRRRIRD